MGVVGRVVSIFKCVEACGGGVGRKVGRLLQTWCLVEVAWQLRSDDVLRWRLTSLVDLGYGKDGDA